MWRWWLNQSEEIDFFVRYYKERCDVLWLKRKSIINKEDIETKYRIVTYNPNKPNKKGND